MQIERILLQYELYAGLLRALAEASSREIDHVSTLADTLLARMRELMAPLKAPKPIAAAPPPPKPPPPPLAKRPGPPPPPIGEALYVLKSRLPTP